MTYILYLLVLLLVLEFDLALQVRQVSPALLSL